MHRSVLFALVALAGCGKLAPPFQRDQLTTVIRAVETCTDASGKLTPYLRIREHGRAENAAIAARNACSSSRAEIVAAVGTGTMLDACYFSVDRQEAVQRAELTDLDTPTLDNAHAVVAALDVAIRQQTSCATAIRTADHAP